MKSLKGILEDEVAKLRGGMALDFSLEKSSVKEELAQRDQKIMDTENRIETEVAKLGTQLEAQKLDLIKYIVTKKPVFSLLVIRFSAVALTTKRQSAHVLTTSFRGFEVSEHH